jgi:hypothetical protein
MSIVLIVSPILELAVTIAGTVWAIAADATKAAEADVSKRPVNHR